MIGNGLAADRHFRRDRGRDHKAVRLLRDYMTRVFVGEWTPLSPLLRPVELGIADRQGSIRTEPALSVSTKTVGARSSWPSCA